MIRASDPSASDGGPPWQGSASLMTGSRAVVSWRSHPLASGPYAISAAALAFGLAGSTSCNALTGADDLSVQDCGPSEGCYGSSGSTSVIGSGNVPGSRGNAADGSGGSGQGGSPAATVSNAGSAGSGQGGSPAATGSTAGSAAVGNGGRGNVGSAGAVQEASPSALGSTGGLQIQFVEEAANGDTWTASLSLCDHGLVVLNEVEQFVGGSGLMTVKAGSAGFVQSESETALGVLLVVDFSVSDRQPTQKPFIGRFTLSLDENGLPERVIGSTTPGLIADFGIFDATVTNLLDVRASCASEIGALPQLCAMPGPLPEVQSFCALARQRGAF
jgi:hypothetical protein